MVLARARVDPWQNTTPQTSQMTHTELDDEFHRVRPQVSLATAIAARFVNTVITRTGEPDYVPLTTSLGLKYKRRMLYFPMDFGELTLDGLVDIGALSSAIPEADLRKNPITSPSVYCQRGPGTQLPNHGCKWAAENTKEHCRT